MTTVRTWRMADGSTVTDRFERRVHTVDALTAALVTAGFEVVEVFDGSGVRGAPADGSVACVVARRR